MTTLGMTREYKDREWLRFFLSTPPIHNCLLMVVNDFTLISTLEAGGMHEGGTCLLERVESPEQDVVPDTNL